MKTTADIKENLKARYRWLKSGLRFFKFLYWSLLNIGYGLKLLNVYKIPVIINNFNRLTFPLQLIQFLEGCGLRNIIIIDNNSTYPPLLEFYKHCRYPVVRDGVNYGHLALWRSKLYRKYKWGYFIYTDSDVVPIEECPGNFVEYFKSILDKNYRLDKVGFGIKIDDLPDTFELKHKVVNYEKRYWEKEIAPNIYDAPIDTTFALYKPFSALKWDHSHTLPAVRIGHPYLIRHMPWYVDSQNLSEEETFYVQTCNQSSSIGMQVKGMGNTY